MRLEKIIRDSLVFFAFMYMAGCGSSKQMYKPVNDPNHPIRKADPYHFANVPDDILNDVDNLLYTDSCGNKRSMIKYDGKYYDVVVDTNKNKCK